VVQEHVSFRPSSSFLCLAASFSSLGTRARQLAGLRDYQGAGSPPCGEVTDKDPVNYLPIGVRKSYLLLPKAEREILNTTIEQFQPGQQDPI
jgi:hypothetical protein